MKIGDVAPLAGAWIEMLCDTKRAGITPVAPLAGAWIEISLMIMYLLDSLNVAPLAGAWIEIGQYQMGFCRKIVAPLAGAWIEILKYWCK